MSSSSISSSISNDPPVNLSLDVGGVLPSHDVDQSEQTEQLAFQTLLKSEVEANYSANFWDRFKVRFSPNATKESVYFDRQLKQIKSITEKVRKGQISGDALKERIVHLKGHLSVWQSTGQEKGLKEGLKDEYQMKLRKSEGDLQSAYWQAELRKVEGNSEPGNKPLVELTKAIKSFIKNDDFANADKQLLALTQHIRRLPEGAQKEQWIQGYEYLKAQLDEKIDRKLGGNPSKEINQTNLRVLVKNLEQYKRSLLTGDSSPEELQQKQKYIAQIESHFRTIATNPHLKAFTDYIKDLQSPYLQRKYAEKYPLTSASSTGERLGLNLESESKRSGALILESSTSSNQRAQEHSFAKLMTLMQNGEKVQPHCPEIAKLLTFMEAQANLSSPRQEFWTERLSEFHSELDRVNLNDETWTTIITETTRIKMKPFIEENDQLSLLIQDYKKELQEKGDNPLLREHIQELATKLQEIANFLKNFPDSISYKSIAQKWEKTVAELKELQVKEELLAVERDNLSLADRDDGSPVDLGDLSDIDDLSVRDDPSLANAPSFSELDQPETNRIALEYITGEINSYILAAQLAPSSKVLRDKATPLINTLEKAMEGLEEEEPILKEKIEQIKQLFSQQLNLFNIGHNSAYISGLDSDNQKLKEASLLSLLELHNQSQNLLQNINLTNASPSAKGRLLTLQTSIETVLQKKIDLEAHLQRAKAQQRSMEKAIGSATFTQHPEEWLMDNYDNIKGLNDSTLRQELAQKLNRVNSSLRANQQPEEITAWIEMAVKAKTEMDMEELAKGVRLEGPSQLNSAEWAHVSKLKKATDEAEQAGLELDQAQDWKTRINAFKNLNQKIALCQNMLEKISENDILFDQFSEKIDKLSKRNYFYSDADAIARKSFVALCLRTEQEVKEMNAEVRSDKIKNVQKMLQNITLQQVASFDASEVQKLISLLKTMQQVNPALREEIFNDADLQAMFLALSNLPEMQNNSLFNKFITEIRAPMDATADRIRSANLGLEPKQIRDGIASQLEKEIEQETLANKMKTTLQNLTLQPVLSFGSEEAEDLMTLLNTMQKTNPALRQEIFSDSELHDIFLTFSDIFLTLSELPEMQNNSLFQQFITEVRPPQEASPRATPPEADRTFRYATAVSSMKPTEFDKAKENRTEEIHEEWEPAKLREIEKGYKMNFLNIQNEIKELQTKLTKTPGKTEKDLIQSLINQLTTLNKAYARKIKQLQGGNQTLLSLEPINSMEEQVIELRKKINFGPEEFDSKLEKE